MLWPCLCSEGYTEHTVFRTTILTVTLILTIGQNAILVCDLWCDSLARESSVAHCHDGEASDSTQLTTTRCCEYGVITLLAVVKDTPQHTPLDHRHILGTAPSPYSLHDARLSTLLTQEPEHPPPGELHLFSAPLRI